MGGSISCSGTVAAISTADMLDRLLATPVVKCDEIAWSFAGVSMAGWNMLLSAGLAGFALLARPVELNKLASLRYLVSDA